MIRVLIAVDGSDLTTRTIDAVAAFAIEHAHLEVDLVHVISPMFLGDLAPTLVHQVNDSMRAQQALLLQTLAADARSRGLKVRQTHGTAGDAAHEIVAVARDAGADQIAMGTRGMGAIGHMFLGSVALDVVHLSPVPVLLVK